jgi:hypothetical protein
MKDEVDAILESDPLVPAIEDEPPPPGQPVVVIEYRSRGLPWFMAIPLLILVPMGAVALYHNVMKSRLSWVPGPSASPAADSGKGKAVDLVSASPIPADPFGTPLGLLSSPFGGIPGPLSLNTQPLPKSLPATVPPSLEKVEAPRSAAAEQAKRDLEAAAKGTRPAAVERGKDVPPAPPTPIVKEGAGGRPLGKSPSDAAPKNRDKGSVAVGFSVPKDGLGGPTAGPAPPEIPSPMLADRAAGDRAPAPLQPGSPADQPVPTREQVLDEIRVEAAEKLAERKELMGLKERARDEVAAEGFERVNDQRAEFREQLEEILSSRSRTKGKEIDELCDRFGRAYDPMLRKRVRYVLSHLNGRMTLQAKVKVLRDLGVPEPGVLDFLANELHHFVNSRNGPRDTDDVRVNAARQLLLLKLAKNSGASPSDLQARQTRRAN